MSKKAPQKDRTQAEEVINEASGKICLAPCQIACPLGMDVQRSHAKIALLPPDDKEAKRQIIEIGEELYQKNPMFPICGYICGICEGECNYKDQTGSIRRRMLVQFIADYYLPHLETKPALAPPTKEKVAVIGGGPAGLMCAYVLSKRGYKVTILERESQLGGALWYIPKYRLPSNIIETTLNNLVRIANIEVRLGVSPGDGGTMLDRLKKEGYKAVFIATGTLVPRPLSIEGKLVAGADLEGVSFGLNLLSEMNQGKVSPKLFEGKKVVVVGGGNVAFDAARTARRLGGDVSLVCLENDDKSSQDGIPADVEEIEGGSEEGIKITYSRGVEEIIGEGGKFKKIKCPRCTSVFDEKGAFNPKFDYSDVTYLEGDVLLITIGQAPEQAFYKQEGLLNDKGRLDLDQLTLMSNLREGVFIGGDVRRAGKAAEAMKDGMSAAESIDRYLKGENLKSGREKDYEVASIPRRSSYKPQPELIWAPTEERLNFEPFEKGFTLEQAVQEAKRCLYCGPCRSCKACVDMELQPEIPDIEFDKDLCINCGNCAFYCPYGAVKLDSAEGVSVNAAFCKACGLCVAKCPALAIELGHWEKERISDLVSQLAAEMKPPKILVFRCQWAVCPPRDGELAPNVRSIDLPCAARVDSIHILEAFQKGVDGVLVVACPEEDCHRGGGSREAQRLVTNLKERLDQIGFEGRLHFCTVSRREPEKLDEELRQFSQKIEAIGSKKEKK